MSIWKLLFGGGKVKPQARSKLSPKSKQSPAKPFKVPRAPEGSYTWAVVGEASYQDAIAKVAGATGVGWNGPAYLIAEPKNKHDKNAVRVDVGGKTVGYLPRGDAEQFQAGVLRQPGGKYQVTAFVTGDGGDEPNKTYLGIVVQFNPRPLR